MDPKTKNQDDDDDSVSIDSSPTERRQESATEAIPTNNNPTSALASTASAAQETDKDDDDAAKEEVTMISIEEDEASEDDLADVIQTKEDDDTNVKNLLPAEHQQDSTKLATKSLSEGGEEKENQKMLKEHDDSEKMVERQRIIDDNKTNTTADSNIIEGEPSFSTTKEMGANVASTGDGDKKIAAATTTTTTTTTTLPGAVSVPGPSSVTNTSVVNNNDNDNSSSLEASTASSSSSLNLPASASSSPIDDKVSMPTIPEDSNVPQVANDSAADSTMTDAGGSDSNISTNDEATEFLRTVRNGKTSITNDNGSGTTTSTAAAAAMTTRSFPDDDNAECQTTATNPEPPPTRHHQQQQTASSSLPVAEEYQELPLIVAEIVPPPQPTVQASVVYHVDIDGESIARNDHPSTEQGLSARTRGGGSNRISNNNGILEDGNNDDNDDAEDPNKDIESSSSACCCRKKRSRHDKRCLCRWGIIHIVIVLIVGLFLFMFGVFVGFNSSEGDMKNSRFGNDSSDENDQDGNNTSTVADTSSQVDYPCYASTFDMFTAQVEFDGDDDEPMELILCPNTTIEIGTFANPLRDDFNWTGGDFPIVAMRRNVTVQCGIDGRHENNCIIGGGLIQVNAQYEQYHPKYGYVEPTPAVDGFHLKGITFTGTHQPSGPFGGISVTMSHPGKGIIFEDCVWKDYDATKRVIAVGQNYIMELLGIDVPDLSVELTIRNCLFESVTYEEEFMVTFQQALIVEDTVFRDVQLSQLLSSGCGYHPNGCRNLMHCRGNSQCSISNVCVENFDVSGAGTIAISQNTEWFDGEGKNQWIGPIEVVGSNGTGDQFCSLGVARFEDDFVGQTPWDYQCIEPPSFEYVEAGSC